MHDALVQKQRLPFISQSPVKHLTASQPYVLPFSHFVRGTRVHIHVSGYFVREVGSALPLPFDAVG